MCFCSNKNPRYDGEVDSGVRADDALAVFRNTFSVFSALQVVLINSANGIIVIFHVLRVKPIAIRVIQVIRVIV